MSTMTLTSRLSRAAVLCLSAFLPLAVWSTDRALLIGVADYPALPKRLWLRGPINDVGLMRSTLIGRGLDPSNIRVLVSRAGGADEPTLANIQGAMNGLAREAQVGDRLILYLSGHGSQQPQPAKHGTRPVEPDGLDEVFLPADVRSWDGIGTEEVIPNALLDDEIGEWIDSVVDKGASVWAVMDTCHAGGMTRASGRTRWRGVSGLELGLRTSGRPTSALTKANARLDGRTFALAARTQELTGEEWMPKNASLRGARVHGVFTFHVAQALSSLRMLDAHTLEGVILDAYARDHRTSPKPVFQGNVFQSMP